jgi:hypothetical protein
MWLLFLPLRSTTSTLTDVAPNHAMQRTGASGHDQMARAADGRRKVGEHAAY